MVQQVKLEHVQVFGTVVNLPVHSLAPTSSSSEREYLRLTVKQMSYGGRTPRL